MITVAKPDESHPSLLAFTAQVVAAYTASASSVRYAALDALSVSREVSRSALHAGLG